MNEETREERRDKSAGEAAANAERNGTPRRRGSIPVAVVGGRRKTGGRGEGRRGEGMGENNRGIKLETAA